MLLRFAQVLCLQILLALPGVQASSVGVGVGSAGVLVGAGVSVGAAVSVSAGVSVGTNVGLKFGIYNTPS